MTPLLLARWKLLATAATLAAAFSAGWAVNGWRWEARIQRAIDGAVASEREACEKNKATTREVADDLRKKLTDADSRYAAELHRVLRHEAARLQPARTAGGDDGAGPADGLPGADPEAALELLALGHDAERQAEQIAACQGFIRKVWRR